MLGLYDAGVFEHTARIGAVGEKRRAVVLGRERHSDAVLRHRYRAVSDEPVETQTGDMQYVFPPQLNLPVVGFICVNQLARLITVNLHMVGQQRIERDGVSPAKITPRR